MKDQIFAILKSIRRRQRRQVTLQFAVAGLLASAVCAFVLCIWKFATAETLGWGTVTLVLLSGPVLAGSAGWLRKRPWVDAASAVDDHYALKDRTVTALEFVSKPTPTAFQQLQLVEATAHLQRVEPRQVIPFRWPRQSASALVAAVLAAILLLWPVAPEVANATVVQPPGIAAAADVIEDELRELEELAQEQQSEELQQLVADLQKELQTLKLPTTDSRQALASISEMQARLNEKLKEFNSAAVDAEMKSLADALMSANAFKSAAAELKSGEYIKAADKLEQLQDPQLDKVESRTASEKLETVANSMQDAGLKDLSEAVKKLSESARANQTEALNEASKKLAGECREQGLRKQLNQMMANKLSSLSECKGMCQGGKNPGAGQGEMAGKNSPKTGQSPTSQRESQNWTLGTHGKLDGQKTELSATRQFQQLQGQLGEGASEHESTSSPEGEERAQRQYRDAHAKYQKMSEAVLESEPIPLGQRQLIRKYFELIRPSQDAENPSGN